jgi:chemotaxis protein methyltransferase CheR
MSGAPSIRIDDDELALINDYLSGHLGIVFPEHKRDILEAKLVPRLRALRLQSFLDYYVLLQYDPGSTAEWPELIRAVTNNESYFFRETHQFEALFTHALDELKAHASVSRIIRFLSAGCSSGEEPYTLNIHARENAFRTAGYEVLVDAFDVNEGRVDAARRAEYPRMAMRGVDEEQTSRYFVANNGSFFLKPMYRTNVRFRVANLLDETAYNGGGYDAIFCRNVLIYFNEETIRAAVARFAAAIRPGGFLFLGHSESIIGMSPAFEPVRLGNCIIYRRAREIA